MPVVQLKNPSPGKHDRAAGLRTCDDDPTAADDDATAVSMIKLAEPAAAAGPVLTMPPLPIRPTGPPQDPSDSQASDRPTMDGAANAVAWLYKEGKSAFESKRYAEALVSFEFCLSKLAEQHARAEHASPFDPDATGYRHLDDYLELCRTREAVERRAAASATGAITPPLLPSSASPSLYGRTPGSPPALLLQPSRPSSRECLIFVCSPRHIPLPSAADEAVDVANVISSHIRRGGSADDLRHELLRHHYRAFLFSGHGDAQLEGGESRTLGFTSPNGGLDTVRAEHLAELLGGHSPRKGGALATVFLNGCLTEPIGAQLRHAGVPHVVCWRTKAHDGAARLLAQQFFKSLADGRSHEAAFEDARSAVKLATRPGRLANGMPSAVPRYELVDPLAASGGEGGGGGGGAPRRPSAMAAADGHESGFTPPPMPAGVPILLQAAPDALSANGFF